MKINTQTAQQFLDCLNDHISEGYLKITAINREEVIRMNRKEVNKFLIELMSFVVDELEA